VRHARREVLVLHVTNDAADDAGADGAAEQRRRVEAGDARLNLAAVWVDGYAWE
jgi:hypothetical protein